MGSNDETVPDYASGVALDAQDNVYVVGQTSSQDLPATDFPVTSGAFETIQNAPTDAFIAKFDLAEAINDPVIATPVFSPPPGTYSSPQTVSISDATPGSTIYVSYDGQTLAPGTWGVYSGPVVITGSPQDGGTIIPRCLRQLR